MKIWYREPTINEYIYIYTQCVQLHGMLDDNYMDHRLSYTIHVCAAVDQWRTPTTSHAKNKVKEPLVVWPRLQTQPCLQLLQGTIDGKTRMT